jgi:hypothetical protein
MNKNINKMQAFVSDFNTMVFTALLLMGISGAIHFAVTTLS